MIPITSTPPVRTPVLVRDLLTGDDTFATTLLFLVIDRYGTAALAWHPLAIKMQLMDDFGTELSDENFSKLMSAITVVTTDYLFKSLPRFISLCNSLCGVHFDPETFAPADAATCAWGITEGLLLSPPEDKEPFCAEIRHYLAAILRDEGFVKPPDVLRIAIGADSGGQVTEDFSDDPVMFSAIFKTQEEKAGDVSTMLRDRIVELLRQLKGLPLENGSLTELWARLPQDLTAAAEAV